MATDDPTARRRRIAEKGSDRLALITGRAPNLPSPPSPTSTAHPHHSSTESCPPSVTRLPDQHHPSDENRDPSSKPKTESKTQPVLQKSRSTKTQYNKKQSPPKSDLNIYLYKTVSPSQLSPAILASQETRRKCSFFLGIIALLSYMGFPVLGSYIIKSIVLSRPLVLLLIINVTITIGPLLLDAMRMIRQESRGGGGCSSGEDDIGEHLGSAFEWGVLLKTGLHALFMDSCIYSVVVVCGTSFLQKFGL